MKKLLTIFAVLIALSSVQIFAQESQNLQNAREANIFFKVNTLVKTDLFKNENEISLLAVNLTSSEKEFLYIENKKSPTVPFLLNFFLGWGIGSFVQGDIKSGIISLSGNLLGSAIGITGWLLFAPTLTYLLPAILGETVAGLSDTQTGFDWQAMYTQLIVGSGLFSIGFAIVLGVQIYSWIRPFKYANNYNLTLRKCLSGSNEKVSVQFAPVVDFDNSKYGLVASLKF